MMIRSGISNTQGSDFREVVSDLFGVSPPFAKLATEPVRFVPARVNFEGSAPLTEDECLRVMATQFYNHSRTAGHS